jgi:hypothetical protein
MSKPTKQYIADLCKSCHQPIGNDRQESDGKWEKHYRDSSGCEHKTCLLKRAMRKN